MSDLFDDDNCTCDNMYSSDSHFLLQQDLQNQIDQEKDSADILSLYK
jgi:hypothetical protein